MQSAAHLLRRPTPPAAASMPPAAPAPSHRSPPPRLPELPLPSALVPPKKRRVLWTPPKATTPIPPPPPRPATPAVAGAADGLGASAPTPPLQAHATYSPLSADQKPSAPPPPAAEKPSLPPPPAAAAKSSAPPPTRAAANRAPTRKVRKVLRKVVPEATIAARKAAAGASQPGEGRAPVKSPSDRNAAADEAVRKEQNLGENAGEKPAPGCNAAAACEAPPSQGTVGGGTAAGELASVNCDNAPELGELVSKGGERGEVGMSERQRRRMAEERGMSEGQRRRMTEVFVGGLNRDAKEEDVRAVLAKAGEITEVRMIMDAKTKTKKNKGYCFVRYRMAAQARRAITEFGNVEICGKLCRVAAFDGGDKIFLGNIDKKCKKEDIMKLLRKIGVENIDALTLMDDCNNPGCNRGFAFLELKTYRDAQITYKMLSRKNAFGKGQNIRVAWAEPLNYPDEKEMQKVKAVFVEGIPNSWDQAKMTEIFSKYGKIEHVVLSRDMQSAKRNDFAFINYTTREAAILCLESFDPEGLTENGSKVNIKVMLAKPIEKGKRNKDHRLCISEESKREIAHSERKTGPSSVQIMPSSSRVVRTGDKQSSPTHGLLHVLKELAPWRRGNIGSEYPIQYCPRIYSGEKRPFSTLGDDSSYGMSHSPRTPRHESSTYAMPSYDGLPHAIAGYSPPYHHGSIRCLPDSNHGLIEPVGRIQMRQAESGKPGQPHGSRH